MKAIKLKFEKIAELQREMETVKLRSQAAGIKTNKLQQEITDLVHSNMLNIGPYSTRNSNSQKILLTKEELATAQAERKAAESELNCLGHQLQKATTEAWRLYAELEIKDILPKLLPVFALWQSSGGGSFEAGMLKPFFEKHQAEIPKIADRLKMEALR